MSLPPWLQPNEDSSAMRAWKRAKEQEQRYRKKLRALDVGVVRGRPSKDDWLPNFGSVWESGPRRETREGFQKATRPSVGPESVVSALQTLVANGGKGMSEEEMNAVVERSKSVVMKKIQLWMGAK